MFSKNRVKRAGSFGTTSIISVGRFHLPAPHRPIRMVSWRTAGSVRCLVATLGAGCWSWTEHATQWLCQSTGKQCVWWCVSLSVDVRDGRMLCPPPISDRAARSTQAPQRRARHNDVAHLHLRRAAFPRRSCSAVLRSESAKAYNQQE